MRSSSRSWSVITVKSRATSWTPSSVVTAPLHAVLDLVAQRAAGDGERDEDVGGAVGVDLGLTQHAEVDDRAMQLRILDGPQCLDELVVGD